MKRSFVEIDLERLRENVRNVRAALTEGTSLIFVVKACGYGHGVVPLVTAAAREGVDWFSVAYLHEALEVRDAVPESDILVLGVVEPDDVPVLLEKRITPIVVSAEHGRSLARVAAGLNRRLRVHVKVDTGMGRLGIPVSSFAGAAGLLAAENGLEISGICSHFSMVEPDHPEAAEKQVRHFRKAADIVESLIGRSVMKHISSSRACLYMPQWDFDAVRLGIVMYGYGASGTEGRFKTRPILQWKTSVMQVRNVPSGFSVSYYGTYVTETDTSIAIISLGYADGYLRTLSNRGYVLIRGQRYPVVGRVTMNWICIDLGANSDVERGDEVVMIGEQGGEMVWASELARYCRTIPYEIITGIHPGIPRHYLTSQE